MSQTNRACQDDLGIRGAAQVIAANATTAFDFGTPNDIDLRDHNIYRPGTRVLVLITALRAAGSTSTLTFTIQDAPDVNGVIGTPAAATVYGAAPAFAAATAGYRSSIAAVKVKDGRPWLRVNAVHGTAGTDSFQCHAVVIGIPNGI